MTLTPEQIAAGWRLHDGSDVCPIKDERTVHRVMFRDGQESCSAREAHKWSWTQSSDYRITAYRIIEAHGADAEPARPTPFPASYDDLVFDAGGWSQPFFTDGVWPEWLPDDAEWRFAPGGFAWHGRKAFDGEFAIRVRRREPKRETVECQVQVHIPRQAMRTAGATIALIDGKPDLSTLKIAEDAL